MFKNIIFDWSGVINDNWRVSYEASMAVIKAAGVAPMSPSEYREKWVQPYMVFYRKYFPGISIKNEKKIYQEAYTKASAKLKPTIFSGLKRSLKKFSSAGIKMFVVSSDATEQLQVELVDFGLNGVFMEIFSDVHDKSTAVKKILSKHKIKPAETIFIGDSNHEIAVARKHRLSAGAVTWGINSEKVLKSHHPDFVIRNIKELEKVILSN